MQFFQSLCSEVADLINSGQVGVMPTDTIYGLVASLDYQAAIERIYRLKDRDHDKAVGTVLISDSKDIAELVEPELLNLAEAYWPGPVSVILPVGDKYVYAHQGLNSLAFRVPADQKLRQFLELTGPLATTSANLQSQAAATSIPEAQNYFGDQVDFYVDVGELQSSPSKIISINAAGDARILRP